MQSFSSFLVVCACRERTLLRIPGTSSDQRQANEYSRDELEIQYTTTYVTVMTYLLERFILRGWVTGHGSPFTYTRYQVPGTKHAIYNRFIPFCSSCSCANRLRVLLLLLPPQITLAFAFDQ